LTTFVSAIFDKQTGCQAELAHTQGNQEAACKRLSRLIHNERLSPKWLAESIAHQALGQVPRFGKVRFTIDFAFQCAGRLGETFLESDARRFTESVPASGSINTKIHRKFTFY